MSDPYRPFAASDYVAGAALLSVASGAIHGRVIIDHYGEGPLIAGFFVVTTIFQIWWGSRIRRPTRSLLALGLAGSAVIVATWLVSRTTGVPIGPDAGEREAIGAVDLVATIYELGIIGAIVSAWRGPLPPGIDRAMIHPSFYFLVAPVVVITLYSVVVGHG